MTNETVPNIGGELAAMQNIPPLSAEQAKKIVPPDEPWSDARAKEFAKKTFNRYEQYRFQNYDRSYRRCDDTYMAVTRNKTREGTRIPRASIPYWMAVSQIESLLPHILGALFADDYPFECLPTDPGTPYAVARQIRDFIRSQTDNLNPDVPNMTLREIIRRAFKSAYIYGAGPIEFGWQMAERQR